MQEMHKTPPKQVTAQVVLSVHLHGNLNWETELFPNTYLHALSTHTQAAHSVGNLYEQKRREWH